MRGTAENRKSRGEAPVPTEEGCAAAARAEERDGHSSGSKGVVRSARLRECGSFRVHSRRSHSLRDRSHRREHELDVCPIERSEEHTSELQSLMRISYAVFCLKKKQQ